MTGGAQFWTEQFLDDCGKPYAGVLVHHYAAGTVSTPATVWKDETHAVPDANPSVGDAAGRVSFYADGDYRLRVETADGILLYDFDNVRITKDQATEWPGNRGVTYPALTALNRGQLFAQLDAYSKIIELGINDDGTGFHPIPVSLATSTFLDLPAAGGYGRLRVVTDRARGVWMDTGTQWFALTGQVVNVQAFDAVPGSVADQSAAFQAAADALTAAGGGVLLIPPGVYQVNHFTIGAGTWVQGAGAGATVLRSGNTSAGIIAAAGTSTASIAQFRVSDLTLSRTVDTPDVASELLHFDYADQISIERCQFVGVATAHTSVNASSATGSAIVLNECTGVWITECTFGGFSDVGIVFGGTTKAEGLFVRGCIFTQTGSWLFSGIRAGGNGVRVEDCACWSSAVQSGGAPTLVEIAGVTNLVVSKCETTNAQLVEATGDGTRVYAIDNIVDHGSIRFVAGNQSGHMIARNTVLVGGIVLNGHISTFANCAVIDNLVDGQSDAAAQVSSFGIVINLVTEAHVRGNVVHHMQGGGFGIFGGQVHVVGNTAYSCGLGSDITNGRQDGFYFTAGTVAAKGIASGNQSSANTRFGYFVESPQNLSWLDNEGNDNVGSVALSRTGGDALFYFTSLTTFGMQPFGLLRARGSRGTRLNSLPASYCAVGSTYADWDENGALSEVIHAAQINGNWT